MIQFIFGCVVGGLFMSVLWLAYVAYFFDEAAGMGGRLRRWVNRLRK